MEILIGIIILLLGALGFVWKKKSTAETLLNSIDLNKLLNDIDATDTKLNAFDEVEEEKRKKLTEDINKLREKQLNGKELEDFFNNHPATD